MKNKNHGALTSDHSQSSEPISPPQDPSYLLPLRNKTLAPASMALFTTVIAGMTAIAQGQAQQPATQTPAGAGGQPKAQAAPARGLTYDDLERLYLDGKISAKQYEKSLNDLNAGRAPAVAPSQPAPVPQPPPLENPPAVNAPSASQAPPSKAHEELERLYLERKISTKQYEERLNQLNARPTEAPAVTPTPAPVPAPVAPDAAAVEPPGALTLPPPAALAKPTRNEISFSGDFLYGQGNVTMPFNFSLANLVPGVTRAVGSPSRNSDYIGATVSYSFGQVWYLDLSFAHGSSSGNADVPLGSTFLLPSKFTIDDNWYQAYIRYNVPALRGRRLSAYVRVGFSYVTAELRDESTIPALGLYEQTDKTDDILGNLGFGLSYSLKSTSRLKVLLQFEGEGFYGRRSQESLEALPSAGFPFPAAKIDNDLYGGIGRLTARFQYGLGRSGLFKIFADGGVQSKFTMINYSGLGSFDELLWGPYAKVGFRYSF